MRGCLPSTLIRSLFTIAVTLTAVKVATSDKPVENRNSPQKVVGTAFSIRATASVACILSRSCALKWKAMLVGLDTGYEGKFDFPRRAGPPTLTYLIATVPRTGSSWFSHLSVGNWLSGGTPRIFEF